MRKIFLLIFVFVLFWINNTFSAWYWNFTQSIYWLPVWCNTDWDTIWWSPSFSKYPLTGTYYFDSKVVNKIGSTIYCKRWDWKNPESLSITYTSWWTNSNKTITVKAKDRGGSKLKKMVLQESKNNWPWNTVKTWNNLTNANNVIVTKTWIRNNSYQVNYKYRLIAYDYALNTSTVTNNNLIKFDTTAPTSSDVTSSIVDNSYIVANNSKSTTITVNTNWRSPITTIETQFEKESSETAYYSFSNASSPYTHSIDISKVDNYRTSNNYRDYTYRVNKVCDEAWNCTPDVWKDFTYHVYASDISTTNSSVTWSSNFDDETADWSEKTLTVNLKDAYGNNIIPVYLSNWTTLKRGVSLKLNYDNSLRLNQFNNRWVWVTLTKFDSSSYVNSSLNNNVTDTTTITNKINTDWIYNLKFKVYSPTSNSNWITETRAKWWFKINSIKANISDNPSDKNITWVSNIDFKFKPIYYTTITWDISPSWSWFVEWNYQTWTILVNKNGTANPTINWLYFVQSGSTLNDFNWTWEIDTSGKKRIEASTSSIWTKFLSTLSDWLTKTFTTLFTLKDNSWAFTEDIKDIRLYQYIKYKLGWKAIIYLAWILNENNTNIFETLKIYWRTNIDNNKQKDITNWQNSKDIQNLAWNITKASLKRDIRKKAINTIKFINTSGMNLTPIVDITTDSWKSTNWWKILWNILYYEYSWPNAWKNTIIWDADTNIDKLSIEWKKTIIVRWWNVRITDNIVNNSPSDILWIIILKDDNWNWGKLYIDTDVTRVDAIIYADKSVIWYNTSYSWWNPQWLSPDDILKKETDWNISDTALQNQLYFYWSIFSDNTIWGSRLNTPVCPFWIELEWWTCDLIRSQKYDLNYLRSWYITKYDNNYWDYPVIIKYNSVVQSGPPPLFEK